MKTYEPKYWNNRGKYQKQYDVLNKKLIPTRGEASTEHGELLRCAVNLYYDIFNNGACNFDVRHDEVRFLREHKQALIPFGASRPDVTIFTNGRVKKENFKSYDRVIEAVIRYAMKCEKGAR